MLTELQLEIRGNPMKHTALHVCASAIVATALTCSGLSAAAAAGDPNDSPQTVDGSTILNDGSVMAATDAFDFSFSAEAPESEEGSSSLLSCPEVRNPAVYTVKGVHYFIADESKPQSTWLEPGQSVSWAVSGNHVFQWDIAVGAEAEAGMVVAKAKTSIDTKISNSWTWSTSQTVSDRNGGKKGYRAVLGQVGYKLTAVKSWYVAPCTAKKKNIVVIVPRKGDMSIGRQSK